MVNGPATPAIPPVLNTDGTFTWNSANSARGLYTFDATVNDFLGSDVGRLTVNLVPEPATASLAAVAILGLLGTTRWRFI